MGEHAKFTDDISGLWGPADTGLFDPAPLSGPDRPDRPDDVNDNGGARNKASGNGSGTPPDGGDRLLALEAHLRAVAKAVDALRGEVMAHVDLGLSGADRRIADADRRSAEATADLSRRMAALERDLGEGLSRLDAFVDRHEGQHEREAAADPREEFARELIAVRAAAEVDVARRIAELEATLQRRLDGLEARPAPARTDERMSHLECRTALLAESIEAYRREATREPDLDAMRDDLSAAADDITARTGDHLTQRFGELAGHLTQTTSSQLASLDGRIARLAELVESHRVQSVMGWELESLRSEVIGAVSARLAQLRNDTDTDTDAEDERRRLEASWQQSIPGL